MRKLKYRLSLRHTLPLHDRRAGDMAIVFDSVARDFDKHRTSRIWETLRVGTLRADTKAVSGWPTLTMT